MNSRRLSNLSPNRRWLVETMQWVGFGQIKGLTIRGGEPQLDPYPEVVVEWKFGAADNGNHSVARRGESALKTQVTELLERLDTLGDIVVTAIEVRHGLPFRLITNQRPPTRLV